MAFNNEGFAADLADPNKTTADDFRSDPKATLAAYGLDIDDEKAAKIKVAQAAIDAVGLDMFATPYNITSP